MKTASLSYLQYVFNSVYGLKCCDHLDIATFDVTLTVFLYRVKGA